MEKLSENKGTVILLDSDCEAITVTQFIHLLEKHYGLDEDKIIEPEF